ncbi:MAG: hypothetical protein JW779_14470 [Candidatus Thorarchaeota archaeon]|nr:hypothetical protein [Candidatus Thorarchaeota archaeon]
MEYNIGVFSSPGAGKIAYLMALCQELSKMGPNYSCSYISQNREAPFHDIIMKGESGPLWSKIERGEGVLRISRTDRDAVFSLCDQEGIPGEVLQELFIPGIDGIAWRDPLRKNAVYGEWLDRVKEILGNSNGFISFVDPMPEGEKYGAI